MLPIKKQFVTDEEMNPVAVLIDYRDWQKIEELLKNAELPQETNKVGESLPETKSSAVDASPKKTANHNNKSDATTLRDIASATLRERIILPPVTTEVKFTLSMLPELPAIHREEAEKKAKEAYVMTLLRHHDISAGRAAELLGINRWELSDLMDVYDICPFAELTAEELQREVAETMMMLEANQK